MKSRFLKEVLIHKHSSKFGRILVITGARQTGKTTLAKKCFSNYNYLSIEDPIMRQEYKKLHPAQWKSSFPYAILDEVQKEPVLIESIKSVYDQFEEPKYILLGSSQLLLMEKVKESLAGRCSIYEVFPLTLPEMLSEQWEDAVEESFLQKFIQNLFVPHMLPSFKLYPDFAKKHDTFNYYLNFGGYPAIIDEAMSNNERDEWLRNYIKTYLERDVRDLADIKNLEPFIRLQQTTALFTGSIVNYSMLAKECGISANTAQRFMRYLEMSYQAILIQPWYKNTLKRLNKSAKLHYLDPGIQRAILKKQGFCNGNEYESAIISEIYKQLQHIDVYTNMYHLRTFDGKEIDLLIELENGYIAIEIKMTLHAHPTDARHLRNLESILDKPLLQSFVLSNDINIQSLDEKILALPAAMFLS